MFTQNTYQSAVKQAPYDVVIIPGIPYDVGRPNKMLKVRMYWAKKLYEQGLTRNIIFSGSAVHTPYLEGVFMKVVADSMGIPSAHTFSETKALHGTENVDNGIALAKQLGFKKIAIATDPFQSIYLIKFEQKNTIPYLPFPLDSLNVFDKQLPKFDATSAFVKNFIKLDDRE